MSSPRFIDIDKRCLWLGVLERRRAERRMHAPAQWHCLSSGMIAARRRPGTLLAVTLNPRYLRRSGTPASAPRLAPAVTAQGRGLPMI